MTETVYTFGYGGRKVDEIEALLDELGADLYDIRFSPASRNPDWTRKRLTERLGDRYTHVKALGNVNYKGGGPIQLVDFDAGLAAIRANEKPVILMCVCKDYHTCHRRSVATLLEVRGIRPIEVEPDKKPTARSDDTQLSLF